MKRKIKKHGILPKLTIITPSFNQGKFIERTIKSVLDQKYPNLEYIVMDGGSTDETLSILKKYNKKITCISEADNGQTHAINKGLKMSTGDIFAYLNSDDTYEPDTFKIISDYFVNNPKASFVYGKGRLIDQNDKELGFYNSSATDHKDLATHNPISQPTTFFKFKIYKEIGEFNEKYQFTMDYEYWIRVSNKFKLHYLENKVLANARIHDDAKTSAFNTKLHLDAIRAVKNNYGKVHSDWINNYIHSFFIGKEKSLFYFPSLIIGSVILNLIWNKQLPNFIERKQYVMWLREFVNK